MKHYVRLDHLPDTVGFPENLRDRIAFDPEEKRLRYRGFMSKYAFDTLASLSRDREYQLALEQLFVASSIELESADKLPNSPRWRWRLAWVCGMMLVVGLSIAVSFFVFVGYGNTRDTEIDRKVPPPKYATNMDQSLSSTIQQTEGQR